MCWFLVLTCGATRRLSRGSGENSTGTMNANVVHGVAAASARLSWRARPEDDGMQREAEKGVEVGSLLFLVEGFENHFAKDRAVHRLLLVSQKPMYRAARWGKLP